MMEHLYRIRKNGVCAGYCRWTEDWGWKYFNDLNPENEFTHFMVTQTRLTAHPLICNDKNGKKVFADDPIRFHWKRGKKTKGKIIKRGLSWIYESEEDERNRALMSLLGMDSSHIELIEDSQ